MSQFPKWKTGDGSEIPINEMDNRHLVNSLKLLRRKAEAEYSRTLDMALASSGGMQGEMAQLAVDNGIQELSEADWQAYVPEIYWDMLGLAASRGLDPWRKETSISRLGTYDACPRMYHCRYELKTPEIKGPMLAMGNLWESTLRKEDIFISPIMETRLQAYVQHNDHILPINDEQWQVDVAKKIPDTEYTLIGVVDYVEGEMPIDYKFSGKPWSQDKATKFYTKRQLIGYCWSLGDDYNKYEFHVANLENHTIQIFHYDLTKRNITDFLKWCRRVIERIDAGNREPKRNVLCNYCGFKKECPLFAHFPDDEANLNEPINLMSNELEVTENAFPD